MSKSSPPYAAYAGSAPYDVEPDNVEKDAVLQDDIGVRDGSKKQRDGAIDERRLMRRIDFALVPWLSFLYLLSFLDRVGIGNARVRMVSLVFPCVLLTTRLQLYGMEADLNISDTQYLICLSVFFVPFCLLEVAHLSLDDVCFDHKSF